jgi:tryptophan-rich sensory protein
LSIIAVVNSSKVSSLSAVLWSPLLAWLIFALVLSCTVFEARVQRFVPA